VSHDIVIVGAGAAGLATAIFAGRLTRASIRVVDGAVRPGAKILVSGGARCNVTNATVTERDFSGGRPAIIRRVLSNLTVAQTIGFFEEIGVPLKRETTDKLFPRSDRSRDVLDALLRAAHDANVTISPGARVNSVNREVDGFTIESSAGTIRARAVVMASGGLSLPKSGSDGAGLQMVRALGHSIIPTTPALAPLVIGDGFNDVVSGVAQDVELALRVGGRIARRITGAMLWTHFGVSGPAALDMSRHWLRARLEGGDPELTVSFKAGATFESIDGILAKMSSDRPRATVNGAVTGLVPASVASALLGLSGIEGSTKLGSLSRDSRRALTHALTSLPLRVVDSRGYNYAEATAGGVALDEIDPSSMESRRCPGLYLVGEMLDVDGRLGGFNFQWAWSSGRTAAKGLAKRFGGRY
jgi:predicted Rossmann fold flavoprotein